jgi:1-deoxy-D-xylulose-5-phosphate synthase
MAGDIEHGKLDALRAKYGITVEAAMEKLRPYLKVRQPKELTAETLSR